MALLATSLLGAAAWGCSDAVPPAAQGSFQATTKVPDTSVIPTGGRCQSSGQQPGVGTPRPTEFNDGGRVVDGEDRASVRCTVRRSGDQFVVEGSVKQGATSLFVKSADVDPVSRLGSAVVSLQFQATSYTWNTELPHCTLTVLGAGEPQVHSGAVWAKFDCPALQGKQLADYCGVSGVFVLENCEE
ncbi:MAG: hypothetical protein KIT72_15270 [Polyangiaceae bacterium]|nr:hypothetical protein [Polyangiaceae bacterium]MCW5791775.1 hypothetical protein [Polyangiaceae bacterium]